MAQCDGIARDDRELSFICSLQINLWINGSALSPGRHSTEFTFFAGGITAGFHTIRVDIQLTSLLALPDQVSGEAPCQRTSASSYNTTGERGSRAWSHWGGRKHCAGQHS